MSARRVRTGRFLRSSLEQSKHTVYLFGLMPKTALIVEIKKKNINNQGLQKKIITEVENLALGVKSLRDKIRISSKLRNQLFV